jgi:hypothetical protein
MDFITGLPPAGKEDYDSILVIVDRFTKYAQFLPVHTTINAVSLAVLFHNMVELRFGPPSGIVTDRGSVFTSEFWAQLCQQSGIKRRLSTAFHPQTDGQTERTNQTLEHYLRCFVSENQLNWSQLLNTAMYACNNAVNATTGKSPFEALHGYHSDFHIRDGDVPIEGGVPSVEARLQKLRTLRETLAEHWRNAQESQRAQYNKKRQNMEFKKGDLVGLSTKNIRLKIPNKKLGPKYIGPFRVLAAVGSHAYRLALPEQYSRLHNVFSVSRSETGVTRCRCQN